MRSSLRERVDSAVGELAPGYFGLVMATGIVSVGAYLDGFFTVSWVLLWLGVAGFGVLLVLNLWRILAYRRAFLADFNDPHRAFGYFTVVAGANVLGARFSMDGHYNVTYGLLVGAGLVWLVLGYVVPWSALIRSRHGPALRDANATWFLWVVASQSVATAAAVLQPVVGIGQRELTWVALLSWSIGVFLYAAVAVLVALRAVIYNTDPGDLDAPYWITMGALAITILAGARIVDMEPSPVVDVTRDLIAGVTVVFWAFATWLIPVLVAIALWRHWYHRMPLPYDFSLWSMVFPLGMYGSASIYLGNADVLPVMTRIGEWELWVAMVAWVLTFVGMLVHLVRTVGLGRGS